MTTIVQTATLTVDGIDFDATLWFDESDNTVDIEAWGKVQSKYLGSGSTPVDVEVNTYTIPIDAMDYLFAKDARAAMADV